MDTVIIVIPSLIGHGAERMAVLASGVLQSKYNVILVTFTLAEQQYTPTCKVINLDVPSKAGTVDKIINLMKRIRLLRKIRKNERPAAVISFGPSSNFVNVFSRGIGKTIISYRGFASVQKSGSLYVSCKLADKIFGISKDLVAQLTDIYPWTKEKSSVIYNRIDLTSLKEKKNEKCDYQASKPAFISVGRLEPVKGYKHLINAFKIVKETFPSASLSFVGDGSMRKALEDQAAELGLDDSVFFLGLQENPFKYLKKSDICVQTSITEGFMNVLVEACACGVPAISTDCRSGPREILSERSERCMDVIEYAEYGVLVPGFSRPDSVEPQKEELLANAMVMLASDKELYWKYKNAGEKRAEFFAEGYFEDLVALIEE